MRRRNLITNPRPRGAKGWTTLGTNATINTFTTPAPGAEAPFYVKGTGTSSPAVVLLVTNPFTNLPVQEGRYYHAAVDNLEVIQRPAATGSVFLLLVSWFTSGAALISQSLSANLAVGTYDADDTFILDRAPATAAFASLRVGSSVGGVGEVTEFTAGSFVLEPLATITS